jgi:hypothetical protein
MQYRDFAYWLQGYFELTESTSINQKQLQIIKNHINLTLKFNERNDHAISSKAKDFVKWFDGFLFSYNENLIVSDIKPVADKLNSVFEHEIDASMPDKDGKLQITHDGFHSNTGEVKYRC